MSANKHSQILLEMQQDAQKRNSDFSGADHKVVAYTNSSGQMLGGTLKHITPQTKQEMYYALEDNKIVYLGKMAVKGIHPREGSVFTHMIDGNETEFLQTSQQGYKRESSLILQALH